MRAHAITVALLALSGCATVQWDQTLSTVSRTAAPLTAGVELSVPTEADRPRIRSEVEKLLEQPLGPDTAVRVALLQSPDLQQLLARHEAAAHDAAQGGRISNPVLSLERTLIPGGVEWARALSVGLLDLLTLPWRAQAAQAAVDAEQLRLAGSVVRQLSDVRQAWVEAVTDAQLAEYADRVYRNAEAAAELARRMQQVGNYSRLERSVHQMTYARAGVQRTESRQQAFASRERLVRLLGLDEAQSQSLKLPERLPDLPAKPLAPAVVAAATRSSRIDLQLAKAELDQSARAQGLSMGTSFTDVEVAASRSTESVEGEETQSKTGVELSLRLPVLDWGDARRAALNARTRAAASRLESVVRSASSHLRTDYAGYRSAWEVSRHYRDEIVPLRQSMSEENVLRYNGMLIGVFALQADARDQAGTVTEAIRALGRFWQAEGRLQATMLGHPLAGGSSAAPSDSAPTAEAAHD